jgi:hypothetical protein
MSPETRPFLQTRARTEVDCATAAGCIEAAVSHSGLARLYIERCAAMGIEPCDCDVCDLGGVCRCIASAQQ